jgi:hypothetical protein
VFLAARRMEGGNKRKVSAGKFEVLEDLEQDEEHF